MHSVAVEHPILEYTVNMVLSPSTTYSMEIPFPTMFINLLPVSCL